LQAVHGLGRHQPGHLAFGQQLSLEAFEAPLARPLFRGRADVPFAGHRREVTRAAQHFGDGQAAVIEEPPIAGQSLVLDHVAHAGLMRIQAGEQGGARGTTAARVVKLRETQPTGGEPIQVWRGNLTTITTDVRETHVVHENDDDVWFRGRGESGPGRIRGARGSEKPERNLDRQHQQSSFHNARILVAAERLPAASAGINQLVRQVAGFKNTTGRGVYAASI